MPTSERIKRLYFFYGGDVAVCKERASTAAGSSDVLLVEIENGGCIEHAVIRAIVMGDTNQELRQFSVTGRTGSQNGKTVRIDLGSLCHGDQIKTGYKFKTQPPTKDIEVRYEVYDSDNASNNSNTAIVKIKNTCP